MIGRNLRKAWVEAAFKVLDNDRNRYGNLVKQVDIREFMRDHVDGFSDYSIGFKELEDDRVVEALEEKLGEFCSDYRLKKLTKNQAVAEALKITLGQGLQPVPEIKLERKPRVNDENPMNIDPDLKQSWSQVARGLALDKLGEMATPAAGAFTGYLGRLFKREKLQHITNETFINNLDVIYAEIQKDIDANKASTGRIAIYTLQAIQDLIAEKTKKAKVSGFVPEGRRLEQ